MENTDRDGTIEGWKWILYLVLVFFLPLFMIVKTQRDYAHIDVSEAVSVVAHFKGVVETSGHTSVRAIELTDYDRLALKAPDSALDSVRTLQPETELTLQIHPVSKICMGIYDKDRTVLDFEQSMQWIDTDRKRLLTIFLIYLLAGSAFLLVVWISEKRKGE
ncbi:MAG: hypothetical protein IJT16_09890 [Lachnospiraceae bacterium]|nr:hypothetical protein [Lachnospiraceae bacterium]